MGGGCTATELYIGYENTMKHGVSYLKDYGRVRELEPIVEGSRLELPKRGEYTGKRKGEGTMAGGS